VTGSITVFEPNPHKNNLIATIVDSLKLVSEFVVLLRPNKTDSIANSSQINDLVRSWPGWTSRPWIIAGCLGSSMSEPVYSGPFIKDCNGGGFDEQTKNLLATFDWALFSYFTTYHNSHYAFITSVHGLAKHLDLKNVGEPYKHMEDYRLEEFPVSCFRNATFYDYGLEGVYAYQVALEREEASPFLLCRIEPDDNLYYRWDSEKNDIEDEKVWFDDALKLLDVVDEFEVKRSGWTAKYMVLRINRVQSYLDIWKEASYDHSIAEATLSGDADLSKLRAVLCQNSFVNFDKSFDEIGTWAYGQIYGGGADEHHAVFRSRDSSIVHQIWQRAGQDQISRY
jgi:hypothetical protein